MIKKSSIDHPEIMGCSWIFHGFSMDFPSSPWVNPWKPSGYGRLQDLIWWQLDGLPATRIQQEGLTPGGCPLEKHLGQNLKKIGKNWGKNVNIVKNVENVGKKVKKCWEAIHLCIDWSRVGDVTRKHFRIYQWGYDVANMRLCISYVFENQELL